MKTAFWFCVRLRRQYDQVRTRFLESQAEAEELNQSQSLETAYDSDFWLSPSHKRSYDSAYYSDSDTIASEDQP